MARKCVWATHWLIKILRQHTKSNLNYKIENLMPKLSRMVIIYNDDTAKREQGVWKHKEMVRFKRWGRWWWNLLRRSVQPKVVLQEKMERGLLRNCGSWEYIAGFAVPHQKANHFFRRGPCMGVLVGRGEWNEAKTSSDLHPISAWISRMTF